MTTHCCDLMRAQVDMTCDVHSDRYDCPDMLVDYWPTTKQYGIMVHDGGESMVVIGFCPWCGAKLPDLEDKNGSRMMDVSGFNDA